jgi:hypothetical protein
VSKFVYVELLEKYGNIEATQFLRNLIKALPYKIHTILTDNGIQFTNRKPDILGVSDRKQSVFRNPPWDAEEFFL